jgi:phage-related holin
MKTFIFIVFMVIVFALGNLYNWVIRKLWGAMVMESIIPIIFITVLLVLICAGLSRLLMRWEIVIFNFNQL